MTPSRPSVYDHYRLADMEYEDGIYRVVGVDDSTVTLLRVGESDGRRTNTGEVITVDIKVIENSEVSENPDGNPRASGVLWSVPKTAYWSAIAFIKEASSHPIRASVGIAFLAVGYFGEGTLPVPDMVLGILILIGGMSLAYVGSGKV